MPDVVALLQIDHQTMARLLEFVERQAENMAARNPVNYRLLERAFDYVAAYPDRCHHPKEDLVYRKLLSRRPELAKSLGDLVAEHAILGRLTSDAREAVRELRAFPSGANEEAGRKLIEFVSFYRQHMLMEDQYFFPAAMLGLSQDDLEEIDFALYDAPDPLMGEYSEARFGELRAAIMRLGMAEEATDDRLAEAALLGTIRNVATFNEVMQRSGESVRLERSAQEGYDLERGGSALAHIPACSEARAAWCAYFFWKATARKGAAPLA